MIPTQGEPIFAITRNDTNTSGGDVVVSLASSTAFMSYNGVLTVVFAWDEEAHGWTIAKCEVDENAYKPDLDGMIGTWSGEFVSTSVKYDSKAECYGGKGNPIKLVVKSADSQMGTVTADLSFLAHCHLGENNPISSSPDDKTITLESVLIPVPYATGSSVVVYKQTQPEAGFELTEYVITFKYDSSGTIQANIEFTWGTNDDGSNVWSSNTFIDNYRLSKVG